MIQNSPKSFIKKWIVLVLESSPGDKFVIFGLIELLNGGASIGTSNGGAFAGTCIGGTFAGTCNGGDSAEISNGGASTGISNGEASTGTSNGEVYAQFVCGRTGTGELTNGGASTGAYCANPLIRSAVIPPPGFRSLHAEMSCGKSGRGDFEKNE